MNIKNKTRNEIYNFIKKNKKVKPSEILNQGFVGEAMLYRHLKKLLEDNLIEKNGISPRTFYSLSEKQSQNKILLSKDLSDILEKEFYFIDPRGKKFQGIQGFYG
jgi:predicted transcriptional regulator